jgi:hypothetical protein
MSGSGLMVEVAMLVLFFAAFAASSLASAWYFSGWWIDREADREGSE